MENNNGKTVWTLQQLENEQGGVDFVAIVALPLMGYARLCARFAQHGVAVEANRIRYDHYYDSIADTLAAYKNFELYELLAVYISDVEDAAMFDPNDPITSALDAMDRDNDKEYIDFAGKLMQLVDVPRRKQRDYTGVLMELKEHVDYIKREFISGKYTPQTLSIKEYDELVEWIADVDHDINSMVLAIEKSASAFDRGCA